jgi:hypothetical protein
MDTVIQSFVEANAHVTRQLESFLEKRCINMVQEIRCLRHSLFSRIACYMKYTHLIQGKS